MGLRGLRKPAQTSTTLNMGVIRTNAAAAMLGVSPNTLRSWERRFGFPEPRRTAGGHRQFDLQQIEALRSAFEETHNVSSAIAVARERGCGPASPARLRLAQLPVSAVRSAQPGRVFHWPAFQGPLSAQQAELRVLARG